MTLTNTRKLRPPDRYPEHTAYREQTHLPDLDVLLDLFTQHGVGILCQLRGYMLPLCPMAHANPQTVKALRDLLTPHKCTLFTLHATLFLRVGPRLPGQRYWRLTASFTPPARNKKTPKHLPAPVLADIINALPVGLVHSVTTDLEPAPVETPARSLSPVSRDPNGIKE